MLGLDQSCKWWKRYNFATADAVSKVLVPGKMIGLDRSSLDRSLGAPRGNLASASPGANRRHVSLDREVMPLSSSLLSQSLPSSLSLSTSPHWGSRHLLMWTKAIVVFISILIVLTLFYRQVFSIHGHHFVFQESEINKVADQVYCDSDNNIWSVTLSTSLIW